MPCWRYRVWRHIPNLFNEKLPLVDKLVVIRAILQEMRQEVQKLISIHKQDLLHRNRLVRVGDEDLEDVEALILHHLTVAPKKVHADLEVLTPVDVGGHDVIIGSIE